MDARRMMGVSKRWGCEIFVSRQETKRSSIRSGCCGKTRETVARISIIQMRFFGDVSRFLHSRGRPTICSFFFPCMSFFQRAGGAVVSCDDLYLAWCIRGNIAERDAMNKWKLRCRYAFETIQRLCHRSRNLFSLSFLSFFLSSWFIERTDRKARFFHLYGATRSISHSV